LRARSSRERQTANILRELTPPPKEANSPSAQIFTALERALQAFAARGSLASNATEWMRRAICAAAELVTRRAFETAVAR